MRSDPTERELAWARLRAIACGTLAADMLHGHRTASRRVGYKDASRTALQMLSPEKLRIASDADRLAWLFSLTAAIERSNDIAVLIDQPSRMALDGSLGAGLRRAVLAERELAAPPRHDTVNQIIAAFEEGRATARALWTVAPLDIVLADGLPPNARPLIKKDRHQRLTAILARAETLVLQTVPETLTPSKEEIAA